MCHFNLEETFQPQLLPLNVFFNSNETGNGLINDSFHNDGLQQVPQEMSE